MSTSGSTDFSLTRDDIIKRALRLAGALAQGETPTADQVSEAAIALNSMVKAWQTDGLQLWAIKERSITLVAGQADYTLTVPKTLRVLQAWNHDSTSNVDIPMRILTKQEYNILGNKTSSGNPIQCYHEVQRDQSVLHIFPVPTSTQVGVNTVKIVYHAPFEDFDSSTDNPDFPQEWYDAITYGLACRLAPEYGMPLTERKALWNEMTLIKKDAMDGGLEEGSLYFGVERRGY